jgi:hypothetical protein
VPGWLRRLLGGGRADGDAGSDAEGAERVGGVGGVGGVDGVDPVGGASVPPPPEVRNRLDAAHERLKQTIEPPDDDAPE